MKIWLWYDNMESRFAMWLIPVSVIKTQYVECFVRNEVPDLLCESATKLGHAAPTPATCIDNITQDEFKATYMCSSRMDDRWTLEKFAGEIERSRTMLEVNEIA